MSKGYVYLLTNKWNTTVYTGVTSNLRKRIYEHREGLSDGFSKRYKLHKLVYFEILDSIEEAISREKQIKAGSRGKKLRLIKEENPNFQDLYEQIQ